MQQIGVVKKILGSRAEIEVKRMSSCGDGCAGCASSCDTPAHIVTIQNKLNAKVGDLVEIKAETKNILKYTMIVYMIPFIMLILGIVLGTKIFRPINPSNYEVLSFLMGVGFLFIAYFIVKLIDGRVARKHGDPVEMLRVL